MRPTFPRSTSPILFLSLFFFLLMQISCSNDDMVDPEGGVSQTDGDGTENMDDDTPTDGAITFEENFVLEEGGNLLSYVLPQVDYNKFIQGDGDLTLITEKVYQYLEDDFDIIVILSIEETQPDGLFFGRSSFIKNEVIGIGASIFNNTAAYGSQGKLKSIIYMPRTEYIVRGPFLHEIAHTWGNYGFLSTSIGGHWGYAGTAGQLGGFDELIDLGSNTYRGRLNGNDGFGTNANGGNTVPYGNIELYIMGLIGPDALEPVQIAANPAATGTWGEFTADAIETITAADIIAQHGDRVPSEQNSQKDFKALTIIISVDAINQDKIDTVHTDVENFSRKAAPDASWGNALNFWQATDGKASMEFTVSQESIK